MQIRINHADSGEAFFVDKPGRAQLMFKTSAVKLSGEI